MNDQPHDLTRILSELAAGDDSAAGRLLTRVYGELRLLAASYFGAQPANHTLQPTALVHEVFLRLANQESHPVWNDRSHFFAVAALAMRQILVNHARSRNADRRGGRERPVSLASIGEPGICLDDDLIALDDALSALAELDARKATVVQSRFFGGMTHDEIATSLGISLSTVEADWRSARAWLIAKMRQE